MAFRNSQAGASTMDGPIPGQSLTDTPGKAAWENPPEYTDVGAALDYILQRTTDRAFLKQYYVLVSNKVPLESIARVILFQGFGQGKWTVDMMVLMAKPLLQMLIAIAKAADLDYVVPMPYHQKQQDMSKIVEEIMPNVGLQGEPAEENAEQMPMGGMGGGLMSPPPAQGAVS